MADDFVNNFGLLGQVLFKKRNEREARQKLDEALSRELTKIAASAGYDKEIAEMRETGAKERAAMGEAGADRRHGESLKEAAAREKRERSDALERLVLNNMSARELQGTEAEATLRRDRERWNLEQPWRDIKTKIDERNSLATAVGAAAQYEDKVGELDPVLHEGLTGVRRQSGTPAGTVTLPNGAARRGRFSVSRPDGTPSKLGETPRNPDNAAPQVPVTVGPKSPTADVKLDSARGIGTGLLENIRGNTWGVGPDSKNMQALVEAYLQKSNPAEPSSILDALGKELGYDQRRPSIKK